MVSFYPLGRYDNLELRSAGLHVAVWCCLWSPGNDYLGEDNKNEEIEVRNEAFQEQRIIDSKEKRMENQNE